MALGTAASVTATTGGEIAVSVREVSMIYGATPAVDRASFDLPRGQFLTILGPSGSGKTTLLRMIAGFLSPTRGEIVINGQAVGAVPPHRRAIGMVFQKLALFPHMSAADNVAFPLKMRRHDARTIPQQVERYLALVRLGGFGGRRVHELSGGQQQRVAIARALVFEPDLLLLDEPLAALDRKLREDMQLEFRRIQKELGVTTINVTHDQREALVVSDEIIVMNEGKILQKGKPVTAYRAPEHPFVAGFIGVTNFLDGFSHGVADGRVAFRAHEETIPGVLAAGYETLADGAMCRAAVRAEQIRVAAAASDLGRFDVVLAGEVRDAIFEGDRIVYEVAVPALGGAVLRAFDHDPVDHLQFASGDMVHLAWNAKDLQVFG